MLSRLSAACRPMHTVSLLQRASFATCAHRLNRSVQASGGAVVGRVTGRSRTPKTLSAAEKRDQTTVDMDPPSFVTPPQEAQLVRHQEIGTERMKASAVTRRRRRGPRTGKIAAVKVGDSVEKRAPRRGGAPDSAIDDDDDEKLVDEESKQLMQLLKEEAQKREELKTMRDRTKVPVEPAETIDDKEYLALLESKEPEVERRRPPVGGAKSSPEAKTSSAAENKTLVADAEADTQLPALTSLSTEQRRAVRLALKGRNLFITGGAGSGKSLLIREIVYQLRHNKHRCVYVTATTGVAALNVRGSTVNSFAGVKFGEGDARQLLKWVRGSRRAAGRWRYCQTLIIDEISMMDPLLLDKLDVIARTIRRCDKPFGGIQVILCGDFLQLPPIPPRTKPQQQPEEAGEAEESSTVSGAPAAPKLQYCFETSTWTSLDLAVVILHKKFRQHDDLVFQQVLDEVRLGALSPESHELLLSRAVASKNGAKSRKRGNDGAGSGGVLNEEITPAAEEREQHVRLCATNKEVEMRNAKYFAALEPKGLPSCPPQGDDPSQQTVDADGVTSVLEDDPLHPLQVYRAYDAYHNDDVEQENTDEAVAGAPPSQPWVRFEDSTLPTDLALKVGTRVMVLQNISLRLGLVNGSVGEVVGFLHPLEMVELVLRAPRERHHASARGQELLQRAGLSTVQDAFRCVDTALGQSLFYYLRERGIRRPEDASYGSVYGNTHCRDILRLVGLGKSKSASAIHPLEMYLGGIAPQHIRLTRLPVVRLDLRDDHVPSSSVESGDGNPTKQNRRLPKHVYAFVSPSSHQWYMGDQPVAVRTQLPLRQAWAMTVHKAQGLTISHVEVAVHRFFSPGQAYVALSRSTRLDNIRLLNFNGASVHACPRAKEFYTALEEEQLSHELDDEESDSDEDRTEHGTDEYSQSDKE